MPETLFLAATVLMTTAMNVGFALAFFRLRRRHRACRYELAAIAARCRDAERRAEWRQSIPAGGKVAILPRRG